MGASLPPVPAGSGAHPVIMTVIAASNLAASTAFYREVFGWALEPASDELMTFRPASGPVVTLRAHTPEGFQGVVPMIGVRDVHAALSAAVAAGATIERAPWQAPQLGTVARFADPAGTIYSLAVADPTASPHVPAPFGSAPKPLPNTVCSLELHAGDLDVAAAFFGTQFGWGTLATMPRYLMFDAGAGVGGVFQSHTPANRGLAYIWVSDVAATLAAVKANGGKALGEPMPMPGMATFGYFLDPSGTAMGLMG